MSGSKVNPKEVAVKEILIATANEHHQAKPKLT